MAGTLDQMPELPFKPIVIDRTDPPVHDEKQTSGRRSLLRRIDPLPRYGEANSKSGS